MRMNLGQVFLWIMVGSAFVMLADFILSNVMAELSRRLAVMYCKHAG